MPIVRQRKMRGGGDRVALYRCEDTLAPGAACVEKFRNVEVYADLKPFWATELEEMRRHVGNPLVVQLYVPELDHPAGSIFLHLYDEDMFEFTKRCDMVALEDAVCFGKQMIDAVAHLHSHGVAHRDIKLENFFRRGRTVCIGDLETATTDEYVYAGVGTRQYWSSAVLNEGRQPYRALPADVWALGITLFGFLFCSAPYCEDYLVHTHTLLSLIQTVERDKTTFWYRVCRWGLPRTDDATTFPACRAFFDACLVPEEVMPTADEAAKAFFNAFEAL